MKFARTPGARWILAGAVVLFARVARADAVDVQLEGAADGCVASEALRERVGHYLNDAAVNGELRVRVRYAREEAEFALLRGQEEIARRRFQGLPAACADRRDTIAIAIALAIENAGLGRSADVNADERVDASGSAAGGVVAARSAGEVAAEAATAGPRLAGAEHTEAQAQAQAHEDQPVHEDVPEGKAEEALQPTAAAQVDAAPAAEDQAGETSRARDRLRLAAGARLVSEMLPEAAMVFAVGIDVPIGSIFSVQGSGIATLAQRSGLGSATVETSALGGEALGCGQAIFGVIGARLCAGVSAASVEAQGDQFFENLTTRRAWLATLARAGVRWPVASAFALQVAVGLHASLIRPELKVVNWSNGQVLTSVVGASFGLDVLVGLP